MAAVQRIVERLQEHSALTYRADAKTVTVEPPSADGFPVSLTEEMGEWVVSFDGWHEHFASEEEALNCFTFGLSDRCRLRIHYRGSFPYRWAVEEQINGGWREESATGVLLFPFWRRPRVEYRQNAVIRAAEPRY